MTRAAIVVLAAGLATWLHLRADRRGPRWQVYLFKPLATSLLLLLAVGSASAHGTRYQVAIGVGLGFSLSGDALLMLPGDRFVAGRSSFLAAHVAYICAFTAGLPLGSAPGFVMPLAIIILALLQRLWPGLGRFRVPVLLYAATIFLMVWLAWARGWGIPSPGSAIAAVGATMFMVSDAILALNRFHRPIAGAQTLIMCSYIVAQTLFALSVRVL